jgi:rRNA maturation protein Nop10
LDLETFRRTFPFVCDECGEFTYTILEHCQKCGLQTVRKATSADYKNYAKEKRRTRTTSHRVRQKGIPDWDRWRSSPKNVLLLTLFIIIAVIAVFIAVLYWGIRN